MKHLIVLLFFCYLNFVYGLRCLQSIGNQPMAIENCAPLDRFCIRVAMNGTMPDTDLPLSVQSCSTSDTVLPFSAIGIICTGNGKHERTNLNVKISHSCCSTDNCNAATMFSNFGFSSIFVAVFATFLQKYYL